MSNKKISGKEQKEQDQISEREKQIQEGAEDAAAIARCIMPFMSGLCMQKYSGIGNIEISINMLEGKLIAYSLKHGQHIHVKVRE